MNGRLLIFIDSFLSIFISKLIYKDESKTWKRLVSPFWNPIVRFCTNLQYDLQQPIADATGYHRCGYCTYVVYPNHSHNYCEEQAFDELSHDYWFDYEDLSDEEIEEILAEVQDEEDAISAWYERDFQVYGPDQNFDLADLPWNWYPEGEEE